MLWNKSKIHFLKLLPIKKEISSKFCYVITKRSSEEISLGNHFLNLFHSKSEMSPDNKFYVSSKAGIPTKLSLEFDGSKNSFKWGIAIISNVNCRQYLIKNFCEQKFSKFRNYARIHYPHYLSLAGFHSKRTYDSNFKIIN